MNLNIFIQTILNFSIEIIIICIIAFAFLQSKPDLSFIRLSLSSIFLLLNIILETYLNNRIIFTLISMFNIFLIIFIMTRESLAHSFYLFVLSYCSALIIQLLIAIPFNYLLKSPNNNIYMILGNIITLIIAFIVYKFVPVHYIYNFILSNTLYRLIMYNILIMSLFFICLYRINLSDALILFPVVTIYISLIIIINIIYISTKLRAQTQSDIIQAYNEYLPVIEQLITEVRERQHQYDNDLSALNCLLVTCNDYDSLSAELKKNIKSLSIDMAPSFLLSFNLKLMSGFLYSEYAKATNQNIQLSFDIKNYNIHTIVPEYVLTQSIGILFDNAIEASTCNDKIFLEINSVNNRFIFSIANPGINITPDFLSDIFKNGYSSKDESSKNRGIGLYTLKKTLDKYHGKIYVSNEIINSKTYIRFKIEV